MCVVFFTSHRKGFLLTGKKNYSRGKGVPYPSMLKTLWNSLCQKNGIQNKHFEASILQSKVYYALCKYLEEVRVFF